MIINAPFPASKGLDASRPLPRVLVAEDNPVCRAAVHGILARLGYSVDSVGDGREALEALGLFEYDVVLLDLEMPEVGGLDVVRELRGWTRERRPRAIALTAADGEREACQEAGMDGFLAKPVRVADLQAALAGVSVDTLGPLDSGADGPRVMSPTALDATETRTATARLAWMSRAVS